MTELPRHPEASDEDRANGGEVKRSRRVYVVVVVVVALLVLMVVLHLTGVVGPGSN